MKKIVNSSEAPKDSVFGICYENGIDVYKDNDFLHVNFIFKKDDKELTLHRHLNYETIMKNLKNTFNI